MDLDKAFVAALLVEGIEGLIKVQHNGILRQHLQGEGLKAFERALDHHNKYSELPTSDVIEGSMGIVLSDPGNCLDFFIDEVLNRKLHQDLSVGIEEAVEFLDQHDPKGSLARIEKMMVDLRKERLAGSMVVSLPALGPKTVEYYKRIKAGERGVQLPWESMNEATLGLWPEDLMLLVSRTGIGKTWATVIAARHAWVQDNSKRVLLATTEISKETVSHRFVALHNRLAYKELRSGKLDAFAEDRMVRGVEAIKDAEGLYLVGGDFDFRVETLAAAIEEVHPDIVILDGAYLLKGEGKTRTERAAETFNDLKRLNKRTRVPMLTTTQFNRDVKSSTDKGAKSVKLENISLTDVAGWNADLVFGMIQSEDMKADKRMGFKGLKVREGTSTEFESWWDLDAMNFSEIPKAGGGDADEYDSGMDDLLTDDDTDDTQPF
jgi:hypothetical protein